MSWSHADGYPEADLDRYAALHAQAYGEAVDATTLIRYMPEAPDNKCMATSPRIGRCLAHRSAEQSHRASTRQTPRAPTPPSLTIQEVEYHLWRPQLLASLQLLPQQPLSGLHHLAGVGQPVVARDIVNQKDGKIEREEIVRHRRLRESGGISRDRHQHGAAQWPGFEDGRQDASAQPQGSARRPCDEYGMIR